MLASTWHCLLHRNRQIFRGCAGTSDVCPPPRCVEPVDLYMYARCYPCSIRFQDRLIEWQATLLT